MNYSGTPDLREPLAGRTSRCSLGLAPEPDAQGPVGLVSRVGAGEWAGYIAGPCVPGTAAGTGQCLGPARHAAGLTPSFAAALRGAVGWEGPACTSVHPARLKAGCASWRREGRSPDPGGGSGCWRQAGPRACRSQATVGRAPCVGARGREGPGPWGGCDGGARNASQHPARSPHHLWARASVSEGRRWGRARESPPPPPQPTLLQQFLWCCFWKWLAPLLPSPAQQQHLGAFSTTDSGEAG